MTERRQDKYPNLRRGVASRDQMRGLRRGRETHGAGVPALTAPIERRERRRIRERFPAAARTAEGGELIRLMATRLALLGRYAGHAPNGKPGGKPDTAVTMAARLTSAHERSVKYLAQLERDAGKIDPGAALQAVLDEIRAPNDDQEQHDGHDPEHDRR